jgi:acyl carrier protein
MADSSAVEKALANEISIILGVEATQLKYDAPLHSLGMDSMSFVELLVFIEKQFKLNLMASGLNKEDFQTIASLAGKISRETAVK